MAVRKDCVIFAAVKRKSVINSKMIRGTMNNRQGIMSNRHGAMPRQKGMNFSVILVPDYLVVPNNLLTHTHTHTHTHTQYRRKQTTFFPTRAHRTKQPTPRFPSSGREQRVVPICKQQINKYIYQTGSVLISLSNSLPFPLEGN